MKDNQKGQHVTNNKNDQQNQVSQSPQSSQKQGAGSVAQKTTTKREHVETPTDTLKGTQAKKQEPQDSYKNEDNRYGGAQSNKSGVAQKSKH